jgi:dTDP-glucose 4,6-dehydratase/UDP-glucuronate decarboxylase
MVKTESTIIKEDIAALGEIFKQYKSEIEGHTFLITGAGGLLGNYMVKLLRYMNENVLETPCKAILLDNFVTGYEKSIKSDDNILFEKHNVIEPYDTEEHIDYIVHAAGIASPVYYTRFPIETLDVGVLGTRNMLDLAKKKNVKAFMFTSSSEVYGDPDPTFVPTKEEYRGNVSILGPRAVYDESKRIGETMCEAFYNVYDVPTRCVRPFNVYGPGIRPDDYRVLPNFIEHALRNEPLPVHGDGKNTRAYCYINDAIECIYRILFTDKSSGESFNIGNPDQEISVADLAEVVKKLIPETEIKYTKPPLAVYADSDPKRRCPDISKVSEFTGYKPKYSLEEGLKRTIAWYRDAHL